MRIRASVAGIVLLVLPAVPAAQSTDRAMTVFVTVGEAIETGKVDEATRKAHSDAIRNAQTARRNLEKALKAQYGSKRDQWPPEAKQRYIDAEEAEVRANANWAYRSGKPERLGDSVEDIKKSANGVGMAGRKENVTIVGAPAEAQLIVEVNGRRSDKTTDDNELDNEYWVNVLIRRGPKLSDAQFAAVPASYRLARAGYLATRLAAPTPDAPVFRFEAYAIFRWSAAANVVAVLLEDFIEKHYDAVMGQSRPAVQ